MLVIPLLNNRDEVVGTLQLMNALDEKGAVVPFAKEYEEVFRSISSQAAIAVTNMKYLEENKALFQSLVEVLAAAIDERSHYNANHTRHVAELTSQFVDFINKLNQEGRTYVSFTEEEEEQLVMAAWLHDIGKIITPIEIMDKTTRLGWGEQLVELRFETILAAENVRFLSGKLSTEEFNELATEIKEAQELCSRANSGGATSAVEMALIESFGERTCELPSGKLIRWLEPCEIECLAIRYGTLTQAERKVMEQHVEITQRLLGKIRFSKEFGKVPLYAADHHEKLNGSGYPLGKTDADLSLGARILTVMDIFEALTAKDRPYKKAMPLEKAFEILDSMTIEGEVDAEVVRLLREWQDEE
jgi:HD-GYP domain-containing protein (c-di-GMP phosphodiesterase class II)